jgi:hypothetical protein
MSLRIFTKPRKLSFEEPLPNRKVQHACFQCARLEENQPNRFYEYVCELGLKHEHNPLKLRTCRSFFAKPCVTVINKLATCKLFIVLAGCNSATCNDSTNEKSTQENNDNSNQINHDETLYAVGSQSQLQNLPAETQLLPVSAVSSLLPPSLALDECLRVNPVQLV